MPRSEVVERVEDAYVNVSNMVQSDAIGAIIAIRAALRREHKGMRSVATSCVELQRQMHLDEINNYGRKGKIFMVHMRNVRGSLATAGAYEEVLLDDGDLNMFKILLELKKVGFAGYINPDHIPTLPGDTPEKSIGWGYSIGYIKALYAALAA